MGLGDAGWVLGVGTKGGGGTGEGGGRGGRMWGERGWEEKEVEVGGWEKGERAGGGGRRVKKKMELGVRGGRDGVGGRERGRVREKR